MVLVCFEISLWILGYRPYSNRNYKVEANPENAFVGHEKLGIWANPGEYDIVLNDKIKFHTTHLPNGQRWIPNGKTESTIGEIAFLGCSFTYGYGVDDDKTFVSNLQGNFPSWSFKNYATPGFGTVQSFLQLKNLVKNEDLKVVVLCFSSYHFMRNVLSQEYRSNLKIGFRNSANDVDSRMATAKFPFVRDSLLIIEWDSWQELYPSYFLSEYLASANWLQNNVNKFKDRKLDPVQTTAHLLKEMNAICQENNIVFELVFLDDSAETSALKRLLKPIEYLNVGFDFTKKKLTNLPYDSHPNALGHVFIAKKMQAYLKPILQRFE